MSGFILKSFFQLYHSFGDATNVPGRFLVEG
jgi:hypothetical protein